MSPRLKVAVQTVFEAGQSTLANFQTGIEIEHKEDDSPVTAADRRAEEIVREKLQARFPGETVLGEEQGLSGNSPDRWVVDPIDGTKSYICGVPLFATLLSWEEQGVPSLGVCYFPALNEMIFAERGGGAYWNGRPATCREARGLDNATVCHGSLASFAEIGKDAALGEVLMHARIGRTWSDAYGHMLVATGRADMMLDPIVSRWDVSAVAVIVQESGAFFGTLFAEETIADSALSCVPGMQSELGTIFTK